jgi:PAS domain S-box-containing protein
MAFAWKRFALVPDRKEWAVVAIVVPAAWAVAATMATMIEDGSANAVPFLACALATWIGGSRVGAWTLFFTSPPIAYWTGAPAGGAVFSIVLGIVSLSVTARYRERFRTADWLAQALDAAGVGAWDRDFRTGRTVWNHELFTLIGCDPGVDAPTYDLWFSRIHPEDQALVRANTEEARKRAGSFQFRYRVLLPGGAIRWLEGAGRFRTECGEVVGTSGSVWDVTEGKLLEASLREEERQYHDLADALPQIVWMTDPRGGVQFLNRRWSEYTGLGASQDVDWRQAFHPDDLNRSVELGSAALNSGEQYENEARLRRGADGSFRWFLLRAVPVRDEAGRITRWFGCATDVDDQKRAAAALYRGRDELETLVRERTADLARQTEILELVVNNLGEGLIVADAAGRFVLFNPAAKLLHGVGSEAAVGADSGRWSEHYGLYQPDGMTRYPSDQLPLARASRGELVDDAEIVVRRPKDSPITISCTARPLREADGSLRGGLVLTRDVTEQRRLLADLRAAKDAAEAANIAKSQFLANMSHEIRTPMNGVLGLTELLLDTSLDEDQRENLRLIKSSGLALLEVINDILDFSKVESGRLELEAVDFDARRLLADLIAVAAVGAKTRGLPLRLEIDPDAPSRLVGDPVRLRQVLLNLVGNALKFTAQGGVTLAVKMMGRDGERVRVRFAVSDTGIGIPAEKLQSIFQPFSQADGSITRKYGGTGLGLTISARLAALMGGSLQVESVVGEGSTFHFTASFPVGRASAAGVAFGPPPSPGLRVLLAEDNPVNQRVAQRLLEKQGHVVTIAGSGRQALAVLEGNDFDLILMDLEMPELDGFGATRALREWEACGRRRTPIVGLTAHALQGDRARCLAEGMDGYVSKPISPAALQHEIAVVLAVDRDRRAQSFGATVDSEVGPRAGSFS